MRSALRPTFEDPAQRERMKQIVESPGFINLSRLLVKVAPPSDEPGREPVYGLPPIASVTSSRENAVPIAEFLKLLEVKLFGHFPQRVVSRLRVTDATQEVSQPWSRIRHLNPRAPMLFGCTNCAQNDVDHCARLGNQAQVAGVERAYYVSVRLPPSLAARARG